MSLWDHKEIHQKKNLSSKCRCFDSFLTCTLILLHRSLRQETQKHTNIVQACGKPEKFLTLKEGRKISIRRKQPKTVIGHDCSDCHQRVLLALPELLKNQWSLRPIEVTLYWQGYEDGEELEHILSSGHIRQRKDQLLHLQLAEAPSDEKVGNCMCNTAAMFAFLESECQQACIRIYMKRQWWWWADTVYDLTVSPFSTEKKAARDQIISAHLSSANFFLISQYPSNEHVTCKKNVVCSDAICWFD